MRTKNDINKWYFMVILVLLTIVTSCVPDPDDSNLYTFKGQTIEDYLESNSDKFSDFTNILKRVQLDQILGSYGQYTCFAPTNDAMKVYIDSLYNDADAKIAHNGMTSDDIAGLTDSLCQDIAEYHLCNTKVTTLEMSEGITITTMLNRTINTSIDTASAKVMLNGASSIVSKDVEATNGVVQVVNKVIPRSNRTMAEEMARHPEYSLFYEALQATGLSDALTQTEKTGDLGTATTESGWWVPTTCKIGYTIFAETNDVFKSKNITTFQQLVDYANTVYGDCSDAESGWYDYRKAENASISTGTDYTDSLNALNMFVRYHILAYSIPRDYLIIDRHYTHDLGSECYEYYETMLPKTLMKIWQVQGKLYINRYTTDNTLTNEVEGFGDFHTVEKTGITLSTASSLSPVNGYIHPINDILVYDADVPQKVLNERMRFDIMSCVPEFMTNGLRWMSKSEAQSLNGGKTTTRARIPSKWADNIRIYNSTTKLDYNFYDTGDYLLYQGDALRGNGVYDLAVKLPPVPAGTYELRICYPSITDHGGMMQFYLGTSPSIADMQAVDIPIDLRLDFVTAPSIRWTYPQEEADKGVASDEALKARNFMRGPLSYERITGNINARWGVSGDSYHLTMRRIIIKQHFDQKDYWLRVKSVLPSNTTGIFQIDYVEFAPVSVTSNGEYVEDMY